MLKNTNVTILIKQLYFDTKQRLTLFNLALLLSPLSSISRETHAQHYSLNVEKDSFNCYACFI